MHHKNKGEIDTLQQSFSTVASLISTISDSMEKWQEIDKETEEIFNLDELSDEGINLFYNLYLEDLVDLEKCQLDINITPSKTL